MSRAVHLDASQECSTATVLPAQELCHIARYIMCPPSPVCVAAERLQQRARVGPQPRGAVCRARRQADALPHAARLRVRVPCQPCSGACRGSAPAEAV